MVVVVVGVVQSRMTTHRNEEACNLRREVGGLSGGVLNWLATVREGKWLDMEVRGARVGAGAGLLVECSWR